MEFSIHLRPFEPCVSGIPEFPLSCGLEISHRITAEIAEDHLLKKALLNGVRGGSTHVMDLEVRRITHIIAIWAVEVVWTVE